MSKFNEVYDRLSRIVDDIAEASLPALTHSLSFDSVQIWFSGPDSKEVVFESDNVHVCRAIFEALLNRYLAERDDCKFLICSIEARDIAGYFWVSGREISLAWRPGVWRVEMPEGILYLNRD